MFVQIGDYEAFDPKGAAIRFSYDKDNPAATLTTIGGIEFDFCGKDYDAFMDWYTRCASVSKFPNGNGHRTVTITVEGGLVQDVTGLPPTWDYQVADYDVCSNCGGLTDCEKCSPDEAEVQYK